MDWLVFGRHKSFYIAILLGLLAGALLLLTARDYAITAGANVFFLIYTVLTAIAARKKTAEFLRTHAAEEDAPAPFILTVMLVAVAASTASLFLVLIEGNQRTALQLGLGVASVVLGWFAVHTMWAMHYAYEYYKADEASRDGKGARKVAEGLDFHSPQEPSGIAFVYFSYVIGMTAQTADVDVVSNAMRRLVLVHSVFSFFFNTVIVAAAVNIAVTLAH
jgi:uncharacterized membrane protein